MKKILPYISAIVIFITGVIGPFGLNVSNACSWKSWGGCGNILTNYLGNIILKIAAVILLISGILFDYAMEFTISMADIVSRVGVVEIGWSIFRDIANIVFIFILLYIAIGTILQIGNKFDTNRLLRNVILMALLINFSLFFTNVIIDASNMVASVFYNAITSGGASVSEIFVQNLNLHTIYDSSTITNNLSGGVVSTPKLGTANIMLIAIFGSILMLVTAFVLFAGSFMLITRMVTLMMLMMLSPLAFIAFILPGTEAQWKKWLGKLIDQSLFAPIFLILLYVLLRGIEGGNFIQTGTFSASFTGLNYDSVGIIFNFILLTGLMVGILLVASELGIKGSKTMLSLGGKIQGKAQKWAIGKAVSAPQRLISGGASMALDKWGDQLQGTAVGRFGRAGLAATADFKYWGGVEKGYATKKKEQTEGYEKTYTDLITRGKTTEAEEFKKSLMGRKEREIYERPEQYKKLKEEGKTEEATRMKELIDKDQRRAEQQKEYEKLKYEGKTTEAKELKKTMEKESSTLSEPTLGGIAGAAVGGLFGGPAGILLGTYAGSGMFGFMGASRGAGMDAVQNIEKKGRKKANKKEYTEKRQELEASLRELRRSIAMEDISKTDKEMLTKNETVAEKLLETIKDTIKDINDDKLDLTKDIRESNMETLKVQIEGIESIRAAVKTKTEREKEQQEEDLERERELQKEKEEQRQEEIEKEKERVIKSHFGS
ncbi:hypothetical protein ACFLY7_00155 [Patescibacteria group bacterium]